MKYVVSDSDLDDVRARLRRHAHLFDRPNAYIAGVEDAVAALIARSQAADVIEMPELEPEQSPDSRMI